jgi:hypothetical protein
MPVEDERERNITIQLLNIAPKLHCCLCKLQPHIIDALVPGVPHFEKRKRPSKQIPQKNERGVQTAKN